MACFKCGQDGHLARECIWEEEITEGRISGVPWCRGCDERTRLIYADDHASRCPVCHPLRDKLPVQHVRCGACHKVIYAWERGLPCDYHRVVEDWQRACRAGEIPYVGGPRKLPADEKAQQSRAAHQVAESRASRP